MQMTSRASPASAERAGFDAVLWGGLILALFYTAHYLKHPALPGTIYPLGWWGWWDQSKYLESAQALSRLDLSPERHWYPLGYAMLAAPFALKLRLHPFFFVDLFSLILTFWGFVSVARRVGFSPLVATLLFLATEMSDGYLFSQWVIPWNTTPVAACLWLLLACTARVMDGSGDDLATRATVGVLSAAIPLFRPTEAVLVAPCLAALLLHDLRHGRLRIAAWAATIIAGAVPVFVYATLHVAIYGAHPSEYMLLSRDIGFTLYDLGWKAYVILMDPRPWFLDGTGLLRRAPWIVLAVAGMFAAFFRGRFSALLALLLALHAVLYLSYIDLLPVGLWRYNNIHYWTWAFPGYALVAAMLLRDLFAPVTRTQRPVALASVAATAVLACLHLDPAPADAATPAKMLAYTGPDTGFMPVYFEKLELTDQAGPQTNIAQFRAFPVPSGLRVVGLQRDFTGDEHWVAGHGPPGPIAGSAPLRYRIGVRLGRPCWFPGVRCAETIRNDQLPPVDGF